MQELINSQNEKAKHGELQLQLHAMKRAIMIIKVKFYKFGSLWFLLEENKLMINIRDIVIYF